MTALHRGDRKRHSLTLLVAALTIGIVLSGCATSKSPRQGIGRVSDQQLHHHGTSTTRPADPSTTTSTLPRTTSTTAPAVRTNAAVDVPANSPAGTTTTTTNPLPPACVWSNFSTTVTTDQGDYATGGTVAITLTFRNGATPCTVNSTGYGCPAVDIDDASGTLIWTSTPQPSTGCAAAFAPATVLGTTWTQTDQLSWGQTACSNPETPNCAAQPAPPGQYQITGLDQGGVSHIPQSAPVTISIS